MAIQVKAVRIESHIDEATEEMKESVERWMIAVGLDASSTAAKYAPVYTGRLKNSITYAVDTEEQAVYIGTNVEYAPYQEFGTSRGITGKHFIQFGATAHMSEYKQKLELYLKS